MSKTLSSLKVFSAIVALGISFIGFNCPSGQASPVEANSLLVSTKEMLCYRDGPNTCRDQDGKQITFTDDAVRDSMVFSMNGGVGFCTVLPWGPVSGIVPDYWVLGSPFSLNISECFSVEILRIVYDDESGSIDFRRHFNR